MSHRNPFENLTRPRVGASGIGSAPNKQQLIAAEMQATPFSQSSSVPRAQAPAAAAAAPAAPSLMSNEDITRLFEQLATTARAQNAVADYQKILSQAHALEGNATFTFAFRSKDAKPLTSSAADSTSKSAAAARNADSTPSEPAPIQFSVDALNRMFKHRVNMAKDQTLLSAYITDVHSTAPVPLAFHLDNVQGSTIEREVTNDGDAATLIIPPGHSWSGELKIYGLSGVDAKKLQQHGNTDLESEVKQMRDLDGKHWSVPRKIRIGQIIESNAEALAKSGVEIEYIEKADAFLVEDSVVGKVIEKYKNEVLDGFKTTNFPQVTASLTRADRVAGDGRAFADFTDAPGIGNKSQLAAATDAKHFVTVKVRFHVVDPQLLVSSSDDAE